MDDNALLTMCLQVSGTFENGGGATYDAVTGNFDGQGISVGILQWCAGQGSLQTLPFTAASTPPAGTEIAPVFRSIQRKKTYILTTTNLTSGSSYDSGWIDTQPTGTTAVELTACVSTYAGNLYLYQCDDTTSSATIAQTKVLLNSLNLPSNAVPYIISGAVTARYWRCYYLNSGAGTTTNFEITATESISSVVQLSGVGVANSSTNQFPVSIVASGIPSDGGTYPLGVWQSNGTVQTLGVSTYVATTAPAAGTGGVMLRTPVKFKTAQATASGNTALWSPSGNKFRLMRLFVQVTANAYLDAGAGILTITFQDNTSDIGLGFDVYLPAATVTAPLGDAFSSGWIDLGNGILSATAGQVLNINLSGKLDAGNVRVTCCGTEE